MKVLICLRKRLLDRLNMQLHYIPGRLIVNEDAGCDAICCFQTDKAATSVRKRKRKQNKKTSHSGGCLFFNEMRQNCRVRCIDKCSEAGREVLNVLQTEKNNHIGDILLKSNVIS